MGVPGLWDVLRPASKVRSLTDIAVVEGFEANTNGMRGFRVGIDASIWFFHANWGKEGENPELRTLFFRCATLLRSPFLPLFVFDGPKRPVFKRGKRITTTAHKLTNGMKSIIEAFGFEWRTAPGEAEAELAYLNRIGVIDAVLSDDVDTFLFAYSPFYSSSNTLSGNRANPVLNSDGRDDKNHSAVYRMCDINKHPSVGLDRGGLILIGLMRGGDYHQAGVLGCGPTIAQGLARCGFGKSLFDAAVNLPPDLLRDFLVNWRTELCHELRTDARGFLGKKYVALSKKIPDTFPNLEVLESYVKPITSEKLGRAIELNQPMWVKEPDLGKLAETCEFYFEWGYREAIIKRFRTVIWPSVVLRILRRSVLDAEERLGSGAPRTPRKKKATTPPSPLGSPSKLITKYFSSLRVDDDDSDDEENEKNLVTKIHSERQHASTDKLLEYRLEVAPAHLVRLTEAGVKGIRRPEDKDEWASEEGEDDDDDEEGGSKKKGPKKPPPAPDSHLRVWIPASIVKLAEPKLVEEYEEALRKKAEKKAKKGRKTAGESLSTTSTTSKASATKTSRAKATTGSQPTKSRRRTKKVVEDDEEAEEICLDLASLREEEEESEDDALPVAPPPRPRPVKTAASTQETTSLKSFYNVQKVVDLRCPPTKVSKSAPSIPPPVEPSRSCTAARDGKTIPIKDLTSRPPKLSPMKSSPVSQPKASSSKGSTSAKAKPLAKNLTMASMYLSDSDGDSDDELPRFHPPPKITFASSSTSLSSGRTESSDFGRYDLPSGSTSPSKMSSDVDTPKKFPLDVDFFSQTTSRSTSQSPTPVKPPPRRRKPSCRSSDEESVTGSSSPLQKSPRKSGKHTSPRFKEHVPASMVNRYPFESDDDRHYDVSRTTQPRPPSPMSLRPTLAPVVSHHKRIEIIEISSSEEDEKIDLSNLPPLLAVRAKVARVAEREKKANARAKKLPEKERRKVVSPADVIDLT
ncbi:hypothetical protein ONZ45_g7739 [Pleurotus djamor]|nr:hypothetical protein ONZ45_g7739 [Pleurotus djamor]